MIWVLFFLQQQEDCCSVIKINKLDHQCIFKCSVTRLKVKRNKKSLNLFFKSSSKVKHHELNPL